MFSFYLRSNVSRVDSRSFRACEASACETSALGYVHVAVVQVRIIPAKAVRRRHLRVIISGGEGNRTVQIVDAPYDRRLPQAATSARRNTSSLGCGLLIESLLIESWSSPLATRR